MEKHAVLEKGNFRNTELSSTLLLKLTLAYVWHASTLAYEVILDTGKTKKILIPFIAV